MKSSEGRLKDLCEKYIWQVFVMQDMDGFDYTSNMQRAEIHGQIAGILKCSTEHGYLKWALNCLEDSAGLPCDLPPYEAWERVTKECAGKLTKNLIRVYMT